MHTHVRAVWTCSLITVNSPTQRLAQSVSTRASVCYHSGRRASHVGSGFHQSWWGGHLASTQTHLWAEVVTFLCGVDGTGEHCAE